MGLLLLWNNGFYDQGVINFYNYWIMPIIYYRGIKSWRIGKKHALKKRNNLW